MQEKPKQDEDPEEIPAAEGGSLDADQKERGYYYDDAHGYERFVDDDEEQDADFRDKLA